MISHVCVYLASDSKIKAGDVSGVIIDTGSTRQLQPQKQNVSSDVYYIVESTNSDRLQCAYSFMLLQHILLSLISMTKS